MLVSHWSILLIYSLLIGQDRGQEQKAVRNSTEDSHEEINSDHLSTLESDGIDMSWLSSLKTNYELCQEPEMEGLSVTTPVSSDDSSEFF